MIAGRVGATLETDLWPIQSELRYGGSRSSESILDWLTQRRAGTIVLDPTREPELHFGFHPAYRAQPDAHPTRESALGLELVNHRTPEASDLTDLWQAKNLDGCHTHQDYALGMGNREGWNGG